MYKGKKILAIIPARGGSKRIKNKNIKELNGAPLISYSINTAKKCSLIDDLIISTDSVKIAEISEKYGGKIPFLRPKKIAQDTTPDQPVLQHAINFYKKQNKNFDFILILRPTTPLRKTKDIDLAIKTIINEKLHIVRSVTHVTGVRHPYWMYKTQKNLLTPLIKGIRLKKFFRSQMLPSNIVSLNGVVDIFSNKHVMDSGFLLDAEKMGYIIIPEKRAIDIDEKIDFDIAEQIINTYK